MKEVLKFENPNDFQKKINESKEFGIRIQKLVYLSKFFGWENSYIFTLNERGPYSINLADNYYDNKLFNENAIEIHNFKIEEFFEFIEEKSNEFLEASSTLIYVFKNELSSFSKTNSITLLNELKPDIPLKIKLDAFDNIKKFNILFNIEKVFSTYETIEYKNRLKRKIQEIQKEVDTLKVCRNQTLILGSLEYMQVIIKQDHLKPSYKRDLLKFIDFYIKQIELNLKLQLNEKIDALDLNLIEKLFNQFQDYVNQELNIISRVDDEEFNYANFY
jgi:uncharacterized protein YwgA